MTPVQRAPTSRLLFSRQKFVTEPAVKTSQTWPHKNGLNYLNFGPILTIKSVLETREQDLNSHTGFWYAREIHQNRDGVTG